jgi:hypothetical protein
VTRLQPKHLGLIAGFLTALSAMLSGYDSWHDLTRVPVVMGILGLLGTHLGAIYAAAPPNPHARHNRRRSDFRR